MSSRSSSQRRSAEHFSSTEVLGAMAMEQMLAKLSTRRYPLGLEPVGTAVEQRSSGKSRSAVSRRFVERTEHSLAELMAAPLRDLDLRATRESHGDCGVPSTRRIPPPSCVGSPSA